MSNYTMKADSKNENVLFLLHLPPPVHGSSLVGQWIHESKKVNAAFSCTYINLLASKNVNENRKITFRKIFDFVTVWFQLLNLLLKNRFSLCYMALTTNGPAFYRDVLLIILLKIFGIKRIYHLHNKGVKNHSRTKLNMRLYQFVFKNSYTIILSERLYTDIHEIVPRENVYVCANGIPDKQIKKTSSETKNNTTKILFLSNLIETKGVYTLLEALKILKDKNLKFEAFFVGGEGDISEDQLTQKIIDFELQNNVKYLGKKYGDEKEAIFDLADIFTFPTYYPNECFPLVILEAMQSGLPVISTFEGGIPDIVENNVTGFLVSQQNHAELAQKIELLCKDEKLRKRLGDAGRIKFEENYSLTIFEDTLTKILKNVI